MSSGWGATPHGSWATRLFRKQKLGYFHQLLGPALLYTPGLSFMHMSQRGGREDSLQPQPCSSAVPGAAVPQGEEVCGLTGPRSSGPPVPMWPAQEGRGLRWGYSTAGPGIRGRRAPSRHRQNLGT